MCLNTWFPVFVTVCGGYEAFRTWRLVEENTALGVDF